jgi:hypothetical protein
MMLHPHFQSEVYTIFKLQLNLLNQVGSYRMGKERITVREQLLLIVREYVTVVIQVLFTFVLVLLLLFCIWIISLQ